MAEKPLKIEVLGDRRAKGGHARLVDRLDQLHDELGPRIGLVRLRFERERDVQCRIRSPVREEVRLAVGRIVVLIQVPFVLAERALQKGFVDGLHDAVHTRVRVVDVELGLCFPRRRQAKPAEQQHAQPLVQVRGVLGVVPQHERFQAEKLLIAGVAIEIHAQARLDAAAAPGPA